MVKARHIAAMALLLVVPSVQRALGEEERRTLAVYAAVRGPAAADPAKLGLDPQEITRRLEEALRATRHFQLYERNPQMQQPVLDEQDFARSERARGNAAHFGELYNVSLIVQPLISEFRFGPSFGAVDGLPGKYTRSDTGRLVVVFKILDTTTGELRHQVTAQSGFSSRAVVLDAKTGGPGSNLWITMVDEVCRRGADRIVSAVWPIKVVDYEEHELVLNRGEGGGLTAGDVGTLFAVGEQLRDPDTQRVLGRKEKLIGRVKVVRVTEEVSIAQPIGELKQAPKAGDIFRRE
jgi:hypothetical protein